MPEFLVCSKSQVRARVRSMDATHLVTLLDPGDDVHKPNRIRPENWLWLRVEDEENSTCANAPTLAHAEQILEFGRNLPSDARVVIHCFAGVSRSTATGLALWLQSNGVDKLADAEAWLLAHRERPCPNMLLAEHFDHLLGLNGEFVRLCDQIGEGSMARWWKTQEL